MNNFNMENEDFLTFPEDQDNNSFSDLESVNSLWRFCNSLSCEKVNDTDYLQKQRLFALRECELDSLSFSMFTPNIEYFNFPNDSEDLSKSFLTFVVVKVFKNTDRKGNPKPLTQEQIEFKIKKKSSIELIVKRLLSYLNLPIASVKQKIESIIISPKANQHHLPIASHWDVKYSSLEFSTDEELNLILINCCKFHSQ